MLIVANTRRTVVKWRQEQSAPVETIFLKPGEKFPDLKTRNEETPKSEWVEGFDGKPKGPWEAQHIVYLVDPVSIDQYSYPTATIGGGIAVRELVDRIMWMRRLRGNAVYPIVRLATQFMQTKFAGRLRPHFEIVDWTKFDPDSGGAIPAQRTAAATAEADGATAAATGRAAAGSRDRSGGEDARPRCAPSGRRPSNRRRSRKRRGDEIAFLNSRKRTRGAQCAPRSPPTRACAMPIGVYDIETRSTVNLTLCGAWKYAAHPSTSILCLYLAVDDGEPERWLPGDPIPAAFIAAAQHPDDWKLVAHNHEFERAIYELVLMPRFGFPPIPLTVQHCTQQLASRNAYPAELGLLSQALGLPYRKDREAAKAMRELSRPRKPRRGEDRNQTYWVEDEAKRQLVFERCRLDVITTRAVWTHPKLRHPSARRASLPSARRRH